MNGKSLTIQSYCFQSDMNQNIQSICGTESKGVLSCRNRCNLSVNRTVNFSAFRNNRRTFSQCLFRKYRIWNLLQCNYFAGQWSNNGKNLVFFFCTTHTNPPSFFYATHILFYAIFIYLLRNLYAINISRLHKDCKLFCIPFGNFYLFTNFSHLVLSTFTITKHRNLPFLSLTFVLFFYKINVEKYITKIKSKFSEMSVQLWELQSKM